MKKEKIIEQIDSRIEEIRTLDDWDLESELNSDFGTQREEIAEWIKEFAQMELNKLKDWIEEQED